MRGEVPTGGSCRERYQPQQPAVNLLRQKDDQIPRAGLEHTAENTGSGATPGGGGDVGGDKHPNSGLNEALEAAGFDAADIRRIAKSIRQAGLEIVARHTVPK